ncbi:uncharacterized protein LOC62_04G006413 [Vanrija pseudolonga]|uniref:Uncharacterized protein n=1 Tax=Vanrija pseudolonga TaxID=143232 RepID=A0AAF1BS39_9TREE|nr:hypothetical protein LOC62_04G006413 [Vanrija pseudolonga]
MGVINAQPASSLSVALPPHLAPAFFESLRHVDVLELRVSAAGRDAVQPFVGYLSRCGRLQRLVVAFSPGVDIAPVLAAVKGTRLKRVCLCGLGFVECKCRVQPIGASTLGGVLDAHCAASYRQRCAALRVLVVARVLLHARAKRTRRWSRALPETQGHGNEGCAPAVFRRPRVPAAPLLSLPFELRALIASFVADPDEVGIDGVRRLIRLARDRGSLRRVARGLGRLVDSREVSSWAEARDEWLAMGGFG